MTSRKRKLDDSTTGNDDQTPLKKRKLDVISSLFSNDSDQQNFKLIYNTINQTEYTKLLNIPCLITKQIAEYTAGKLIDCSNKPCPNKICTLEQDFEDNNVSNHNNLNSLKTLKYKYDLSQNYFGKFYCFHCMEYAIPKEEIPNHTVYCSNTECHNKYLLVCDKCVSCNNRPISPCSKTECCKCKQKLCDYEACINKQFELRYSGRFQQACKKCYYDANVECIKCKCKGIVYEFQRDRKNKSEAVLTKCQYKNCDIIIHEGCKNLEKIKYKILKCNINKYNQNIKCDETNGPFCDKHDVTFLCNDHGGRNLEKFIYKVQPQVTYEKGLNMLLNNNYVRLFDFKQQKWIQIIHTNHWNKTRRIQVHCPENESGNKYMTIRFPSVSIKIN